MTRLVEQRSYIFTFHIIFRSYYDRIQLTYMQTESLETNTPCIVFRKFYLLFEVQSDNRDSIEKKRQLHNAATKSY